MTSEVFTGKYTQVILKVPVYRSAGVEYKPSLYVIPMCFQGDLIAGELAVATLLFVIIVGSLSLISLRNAIHARDKGRIVLHIGMLTFLASFTYAAFRMVQSSLFVPAGPPSPKTVAVPPAIVSGSEINMVFVASLIGLGLVVVGAIASMTRRIRV
ncbi:hypothetical protein [Methanopyrus kandleri]